MTQTISGGQIKDTKARRGKIVLMCEKKNPVLSYAMEEIEKFLGNDYNVQKAVQDSEGDWVIRLMVDQDMKPCSFSISCVSVEHTNCCQIDLRGADSTCVLHAVYTMLEKVGLHFDITGPIMPKNTNMNVLKGFSVLIRPAVKDRGARIQLNFPMDISSYPLDEALEHIRNIARMRMNYLIVRGFPEQFYELIIDDKEYLAGHFFYGQRLDIPDDDPVIKSAIRNDSVFCIPSIEPFFNEPKEKSRKTIEWLQVLLKEAKNVGLKVNFTILLREQDMKFSMATCKSVIEVYPLIDVLEIMTVENSSKLSEEIDHNTKVITLLQKTLNDSDLEFSIGLYSTDIKYLKPNFKLMRSIVAENIQASVLPAHGARESVSNLAKVPVDKEDLLRTRIYSWIEFDGLIYMQQNPIEGMRMMLQEGKRLLGDDPMNGICWIHWRTAENRTAFRYAALASVEGPIQPDEFYQQYALSLQIGNVNEYIMAMKELDDADNYSRENLFNIGFCWGGFWNLREDRGPLSHYGKYDTKHIEEAIMRFASSLEKVKLCLCDTTAVNGRKYLELLENRLSCTILHLKSFIVMASLKQLFGAKDAAKFTFEDKAQIIKVCTEALEIQHKYIRLHAEKIDDRGCEGTLISYYHGPMMLVRNIRKTYGGYEDAIPVQKETVDAPPAPLEVEK